MITKEQIDIFLNGIDPQKRISNIECGYNDTKVKLFSRDDENNVIMTEEDYYPFVHATVSIAKKMFGGDRSEIKHQLSQNYISVKSLRTTNDGNFEPERMKNGYRLLFYANRPMTYSKFQKFFETALNWDKKASIFYSEIYIDDIPGRHFLSVAPVEQFLISTGKRFFKGYDDYDDLLRLVWDIETTGLDPRYCEITQIGIRTNREFEKIIHVNEKTNELKAIEYFLYYLGKVNPDVVSGHNSENFDWSFILTRAEILGGTEWFQEASEKYTRVKIYKKSKQQVLKLGGEMEYYFPTVWYGKTIIDSLHAVRRAQAIDSNFKSGSLKYAAEYAKVKKPNRVYIPGDKIAEIYNDKKHNYVLNEKNGEWYKLESGDEIGYNDDMKVVTGKYIADMYLFNDLYEADRVEYIYNSPNFFMCKLLPIPYQRVVTMGTAAIWKYMLLAWSYENNLSIPLPDKTISFTGGLSRLWKTGYINKIVKMDFNSLYPSITICWDIFPDLDISGAFKSLLNHILSERERYKELQKQYGKKVKQLKEENASSEEIRKAEINETRYGKLQLPAKISANSFFGAFGSGNVFNWSSIPHAEQITCTARQCLRLMTKWMMKHGFEPIVGDTDGINFTYNNIDLNHTYIEKGLNRNTKEGVERKGVEAYVAEFNDLFMRSKMGLGIDEYSTSSIYFARKNYCELLDNGKIKLVGNSIKSKKLPKFIEKFIDNNIPILLQENGYQFLINYYDYINKIHNRQIPLRDIASIGKIKVSLSEYQKAMKGKNKLGNDKAKQAWYELVIRDNINVHPGDTIYYVNTGTKKGEGDVVKTPIYQLDNEGKPVKVDKTDKTTGEIIYGKKGNPLTEKQLLGHEYVLNCVRIDEKILDSDIEYIGNEEIFGDNPIIYNVEKYIEQFNKRIKGLLVCFHPDIRNNILISNPKDRKYYTKEQSQLVSGMPNKETDQDTLEELFTMEDKEIKFWLSVPDVIEKLPGKCPPFLDTPELTEAMGDWETIKKEYEERQEILKQEGIKDEVELYNKIISSKDDRITIGEKLTEIFDAKYGFFYSKKYGVKISSCAEIFGDSDKYTIETVDEDIAENTIRKEIKEEDLFPF